MSGESGYAKFSYSDGQYEGDYLVKKHGVGKYIWNSANPNSKEADSDGRSYYGEWKDNQIHGFGVHTWPDGRKYMGQWRNNQMHGIGLYNWSADKLFIGEY